MKVSVQRVKPNKRVDQSHVDHLVKVIAAGRALLPIDVYENKQGVFCILDGHHRFAAYSALGFTEVEIEVASTRLLKVPGEN